MEIWKQVNGFDDYFVSNTGRVKRIRKNRETIYKAIPNKHRHFYLQLGLWKDRKKTTKKVHRLVAEHFIPRVIGKDDINHIDGNKNNNAVENLEWCDQKENTRHGIKMGLIKLSGEESKASKLKLSEVNIIRNSSGNQLKIAKRYNISQANVSLIRLGKTWKV